MTGNYGKLPMPYFESIRPNGTKMLKVKILVKRFKKHTERIYEVDLEPMITGKSFRSRKERKFPVGAGTTRLTRNDNQRI